jgi:hypothetical protein
MNLFNADITTIKGISDKAERLRFILLLLLIFSLPFNIVYSSVIFLAFAATTLIGINRERIKEIPRQVWLFQVVYFLSMAGYFASFNRHEAAFLLERQMTILLMPILLPLAIKIDKDKLNTAVNFLVMSCVLATLYLFLNLVLLIVVELKRPVFSTIFSGAFFNHQFSRPLGIHAGYLSLYVSLSVFQLVYKFNLNSSWVKKIIIGLSLLILFSGMFFLASRNTLIATFGILLFVFPMFNIKNKTKYVLITSASVIMCFFVLRGVPYLWDRFSKELAQEMRLSDVTQTNYYSAEPRIDRWKGGLELIKRSPIFGYGTGDERDLLKTEYINRGLYISYLEEFNAHNVYLSYAIKNGVAGLLVFLAAFAYYFKLAAKKNFMYLSFLLLLIIGFYTENILDANKGILFFAIFNTLFGYSALKDRNDKKLLTDQ